MSVLGTARTVIDADRLMVDENHTTAICCPSCGNSDVVGILYGLPAAEAGRAAETGQVVLGGCTVTRDSPDTQCRSCGHDWLAAV
jgi:hypothetical protein